MLVFERDDTWLSWDNQHLIECARAARCRDTLRRQYQRAAGELLLAIADAIAWCSAKGGDWRRRIEPVGTATREVSIRPPSRPLRRQPASTGSGDKACRSNWVR